MGSANESGVLEGEARRRLGRGFFSRDTLAVARDLLGCRLVRVLGGERLSGRIVETEAYRGAGDPASHAFRGKTRRNAVMFGPPGHAYVYFTMGRHFCLNVTTESIHTPAAVLIRAAEPCEGLLTMRRRRGVRDVRRLASGPGNVTRAFGIDRGMDGEDIVKSSRLFLERDESVRRFGTSTRVGVSKGVSFRWRYFVIGSQFVSRGRPADAQNP